MSLLDLRIKSSNLCPLDSRDRGNKFSLVDIGSYCFDILVEFGSNDYRFFTSFDGIRFLKKASWAPSIYGFSEMDIPTAFQGVFTQGSTLNDFSRLARVFT